MQWAPRAPPALAPGLGARGGSKEAGGQEGDDESTARFWFPSPVVDPINVPLPSRTRRDLGRVQMSLWIARCSLL